MFLLSFTGFSTADQEGPSIREFSFERFMSSCSSSDTLVEPPTKKRKKSGDKQQKDHIDTNIKLEVASYLMEKAEPFQDPLIWWKANAYRFPILSKLARELLSAPPSSVESERLFSIGGNIYTSKRNRLTPEHGEMLMFLNFNLRAFNYQY